MVTTASTRLTIEQYERLPDDGRRTELVRGEIVVLPPTKGPHGLVCSNIDFALRTFLQQHHVGRVFINDSGVVTTRNPDSLRGPDVAFFSYARLPKGPVPNDYPRQLPEVVFEVRSPSERMATLAAKAAEYLAAGVLMVCVVDPAAQGATVYRAGQPAESLAPSDAIAFPPPLELLSLPVQQLFEGLD